MIMALVKAAGLKAWGAWGLRKTGTVKEGTEETRTAEVGVAEAGTRAVGTTLVRKRPAETSVVGAGPGLEWERAVVAWVEVAKQLDVRSLLRLERCSRGLRSVTHSAAVWHRVPRLTFQDDFVLPFLTLSTDRGPLTEGGVNKVARAARRLAAHGARPKTLEFYNFPQKGTSSVLCFFAHGPLDTLVLKRFWEMAPVRELDLGRLRTLVLQPMNLSRLKSLNPRRLTGLRHLCIGAFDHHDTSPDWQRDGEKDAVTAFVRPLAAQLLCLRLDYPSSHFMGLGPDATERWLVEQGSRLALDRLDLTLPHHSLRFTVPHFDIRRLNNRLSKDLF